MIHAAETRLRIALLTALLALCGGLVSGPAARAQDAERFKMHWSIAKDTAWIYDAESYGPDELGMNGKTVYAVFSADVTAKQDNAPFNAFSGVALPKLAMQLLSQDSYAVGDAWTVTIPIAAEGVYTIDCSLKEVHEVDGKRCARVEVALAYGDGKKHDPEEMIIPLTMDGWFEFNLDDLCLHSMDLGNDVETATPDPKHPRRTIKQKVRTGNRAVYRWKVDMEGQTLQKMIEDAVAECVKSLSSLQEKDGYLGDPQYKNGYGLGSCSLTVLALLKAGVDKDEAVIQKAMNWMRKHADEAQTYSLGLFLMALEAYATPGEELQAEENNLEIGSLDLEPRKLSRGDEALMKKALDRLLKGQSKPGAWTYAMVSGGTGNNAGAAYDNSNAQYGVLGMYAAARCGIYAHPGHYRAVLDHWLEDQMQNGPQFFRKRAVDNEEDNGEATGEGSRARGWGYTEVEDAGDDVPGLGDMTGATRSMTCAGIGSMSIAYACLQKTEKSAARKYRGKVYHSVDDGLAWLEKNYTVNAGDGMSFHHLYYLYGLERACVLAGVRMLGGRNWYREGAAYLCSMKEGGGFLMGESISRFGDASDTAFTLLFLKQATAPLPPLSGDEDN